MTPWFRASTVETWTPLRSRIDRLRGCATHVLHRDPDTQPTIARTGRPYDYRWPILSDWTCIVFDNASTEPLRDAVEAFGTPGLPTHDPIDFSPSPIAGTAQSTLREATMCLFIGDDDGLTPQALETVLGVPERMTIPDLVYSALYQFFHPGVLRGSHQATSTSAARLLLLGSKRHFSARPESGTTGRTGSLEFRRNFAFNMQAFFFRREFP